LAGALKTLGVDDESSRFDFVPQRSYAPLDADGREQAKIDAVGYDLRKPQEVLRLSALA
jgi:hypothetical protein